MAQEPQRGLRRQLVAEAPLTSGVGHRELRYFVAVAEELHFTRAAERLHISQPPLSAAIARLELKVGTLLMIRNSRNVRLTPAGSVLLDRARPILASIDAAVVAARRAAPREAVRLHLAVTAGSRHSTLPLLRQALMKRFPDASIEPAEMIPEAVRPSVASGDSDLGVVISSGVLDGLETRLLRRHPAVAVVDDSNPIASRKSVTLKQLATGRLVLWPEQQAGDSYRTVLALFDGFDIAAPVEVPIADAAWLSELAAGGFCVLPVDAPILDGYTGVPIDGLGMVFETWLAWRPDNPCPMLHESLEVADELAALHGWLDGGA